MNKQTVASEEIVEILRDAIISGEMKPRERLIEADLSAKYNVSRTPIREAIKRLSATGLVEVIPYKGAFVADINIDEIGDIYNVRIILEGQATRLAVKRIPEEAIAQLEKILDNMESAMQTFDKILFEEGNEEFHRLIYSYCGNKVMESFIDELLSKSAMFRRSSWQSERNSMLIVKTHRGILEAIKNKDEDVAQELAENHIRLFLRD